MKNLKYILFTLGGILIYSITKASKKMANRFINFTNPEIIKLTRLQEALIKAGLKEPVLKFALSQLLFETGRFTKKSKVAIENNNYTGIKWLNKSYQKAYRGTLAPPNERVSDINSPINYYAKFDSVDDWAKDFVRIISLQRAANLSGKPIAASTLTAYVDRLALNNYFDGNTPDKRATYFKGCKKFFDMLAN
jgi:hypothetical protein